MKYIVYRGLRHKEREDYEYEEGKMEQTLTIISKNSEFEGRYISSLYLRKRLTPKLTERLWRDVGVLFRQTMGNDLHQFHTRIFYHTKTKEERGRVIKDFEAYNKIEKILPGHYEF